MSSMKSFGPAAIAVIGSASFGFNVLLGSPALADRKPTPAERTQIEQTLRANGFVTWDEIEFDDGQWEVDDARRADGSEWEVDIAPNTYQIVKLERDD
ncbi:MAG: PepSY domain-containing protein [Hyphomicrobiaceae bacterium]